MRREALDGMPLRGSGSGALRTRYREAVVAGEGVVEDLDDALDMADHARRLGAAVEVVVFEVPQFQEAGTGTVLRGSLPVVPTAPAEGLVCLGWDLVEPIEPWWSPLATSGPVAPGLNAHGLFEGRAAAEKYAAEGIWDVDEALVAARIWVSAPTG